MDKKKSKEALEELKKRDKALTEANKAIDKTLDKLNKQEIGMAEYYKEKLEEKTNNDEKD